MRESKWEYFGDSFDVDFKKGSLMVEYYPGSDFQFEIIQEKKIKELYEVLKEYFKNE